MAALTTDDSAKSARMLFEYNPETGLFRRKVRTASRCNMGWTPGSLSKDGYFIFHFAGKKRRAHRLAFLIMNGSWPDQDVDHINGNRGDNRWNNLRLATRQQNMFNMRPTGKLPFKGVYQRSKNSFAAVIRHGGTRYHLGSFPTPEIAASAYQKAAADFFGEYRWKP